MDKRTSDRYTTVLSSVADKFKLPFLGNIPPVAEWLANTMSSGHGRRYHTNIRIMHMLGVRNAFLEADELAKELGVDMCVFEVATLFHDIIIGKSGGTSEELSANIAEQVLTEIGFPKDFIDLVRAAIVSTDYSRFPTDLEFEGLIAMPIARFMRLADFSGFAEFRTRTMSNAKNVIWEYTERYPQTNGFVALFPSNRMAFLKSTLKDLDIVFAGCPNMTKAAKDNIKAEMELIAPELPRGITKETYDSYFVRFDDPNEMSICATMKACKKEDATTEIWQIGICVDCGSVVYSTNETEKDLDCWCSFPQCVNRQRVSCYDQKKPDWIRPCTR